MSNAPPSSEQDALREFLADRDVPCPACGYNLRSLPGDICPECGEPLQLAVVCLDPPIFEFLLLIVPMVAQAGLAIVFLIVFILGITRGESSIDQTPWGMRVVILAGLIDGLMIPVLHQWRASFLRLPDRLQGILIAASWVINLATAVLCLVTL